LIVDDDPGFRALVSSLLGRAALAAEEAVDGEEAIALARRQRPALVVLDVSLPDLSGFEVCRQLRDEFGEELPIMFVSGERIEPLDRAVGILVGGDDYVIKPFDADEFLARVRRFLKRSTRARADGVPTVAELGLTKRELEVLRLLAAGRRPGEIAAELVISGKTVASHIQRVLGKLDVHSQAQAVARAYELGLMAPPGGKASTDGEVDAHIADGS
jgi:DNA-binding NarL/FixJ family response regulator